jgi:hypothetical protein
MDQLTEAVGRVATYGGGRCETWHIPPGSAVHLADGDGHLLAGAVITHWTRD